ncbi:hypothetical protein CHH28_07800 [Bacterioplanes sanyensis]|uniref:Short chain dehydrogenase n=1 Tax=Bacterioplanes sanyensis TaxID=1249553 RepID=A0A222FK24_9GAMM|nr:SDR family NAD(P)-dependent oxidoreductase [Bacterioplanes sanyensis]ASP38583.1 hypothetical protein CHH28_07800 [Bacterioplanes sanyensis]
MLYPLANKVAIVTGAAGGLGRSLCDELLARGTRVMATDIDSNGLEELSRQIDSSRLSTCVCDVTKYDSCTNVVEMTEKTFGGIDLLLNNAGVTHFNRFHEAEIKALNTVIDINLKGAVNITHACMNNIIEHEGFIVGLSSVAGFSPLYARSAYSASKYGLAGLMETLRSECYEYNVSVLSVFPGFIQTQDDNHESASSADVNSSRTNGIARPGQATATPGKTLQPEEAAAAIVNAIEKKKRVLHLGSLAKSAYWLHKISPWLYEKVMLRKISMELKAV